nr:MAG TPA: hypothetical protein [Caudoviricetes sp.]
MSVRSHDGLPGKVQELQRGLREAFGACLLCRECQPGHLLQYGLFIRHPSQSFR